MPELPDIAVYIDRLAARIVGHRLLSVRLLNPFLLRTALPPSHRSRAAGSRASSGSASGS
jgi:formamidopyrimidine-DNA glycosylase